MAARINIIARKTVDCKSSPNDPFLRTQGMEGNGVAPTRDADEVDGGRLEDLAERLRGLAGKLVPGTSSSAQSGLEPNGPERTIGAVHDAVAAHATARRVRVHSLHPGLPDHVRALDICEII
jgi:hypothetical protein